MLEDLVSVKMTFRLYDGIVKLRSRDLHLHNIIWGRCISRGEVLDEVLLMPKNGTVRLAIKETQGVAKKIFD